MQSFTHTFAEALLHIFIAAGSVGGTWGAEPKFELGPAIQQASALLSVLRCTCWIYNSPIVILLLKPASPFSGARTTCLVLLFAALWSIIIAIIIFLCLFWCENFMAYYTCSLNRWLLSFQEAFCTNLSLLIPIRDVQKTTQIIHCWFFFSQCFSLLFAGFVFPYPLYSLCNLCFYLILAP
jgi:hypothetical protein